jgi:hypothetical protein
MARVKDAMGAGTSAQQAKALVGTAGAVTAAGTNAATATVLSYAANAVTAASSLDGVVLPTGAQGSSPGDVVHVLTVSSTTAKVYPASGETLNGGSSAISVAQNKMLICVKYTGTAWGAIVTA